MFVSSMRAPWQVTKDFARNQAFPDVQVAAQAMRMGRRIGTDVAKVAIAPFVLEVARCVGSSLCHLTGTRHFSSVHALPCTCACNVRMHAHSCLEARSCDRALRLRGSARAGSFVGALAHLQEAVLCAALEALELIQEALLGR